MAEASYTSKIKFSIDDLMSSLAACKTQAEQVDGVLSNIGKRGNLNNFIKQFIAMDDAVKALRKDLDSVKAGLGDKLNSGWVKSFDEMVEKMSQISELSKIVFEGLSGVNLKDKGATKELRSYAEQLNTILRNVGIDKQIDLELFSTKDIQKQFDELIQYAGELNGKLNVAFGEIDLSKVGDNIKSAGDKVSSGIKETGNKISAEVQQQIDELEKQKAKYQEALDIFSGKGTRVKTTKKNDVATLTNLVDEFKKAELELSRKEQGSSGYEEAFARKVKAATLLKNTADYVADHGSNKGSEYVAMYSKEYEKAQQFLEKFSEKQKTILEKIKNEYKQKIQEINTEIAKLGKDVPETKKEPKNATISYEKLTKSVERYYELQRQLDTAADSNEFNKIADEADKIAESFINMDSACSAVFDGIQDGLGKSEALSQLADILNVQPSGAEAGVKAAQEAADAAKKKADEEERAYQAITKSVEAQRVMYHLGTGSAINGKGTRSDTFADMLDNLTTNAKGTRYEKYGYGLLGSGIFGVQNPNTIPKEQAASAGKFIYSLDLSKYNMYLLDTEERAANLMDFMSKLQKIAIRGAVPDYTGFNEFLGNTDLNSLYDQFKTLFDETKFTKEQLGSFIDEMVSQLTQAGLFFDSEKGQLDFHNISDELANSDNISTRFFKKLGYQGVNVGNTSLDGFGQGSVLFDFNQSDIVGYFNTIEQAAQDFQNNLKSGWVGSNEQLQQYLANIEDIIAKISTAKQNKLQLMPNFDTSDYDNTLALLNNVKQNISNILSNNATESVSSSFAIVTDNQTAQLEKEKQLMQEIAALKEKLNAVPTNPVDASELETAQKQVQELEEEILRMEGALDSWKSSYYEIQQSLDYSIPMSEVENMTSNDVVYEYRAQIESLSSTIDELKAKLAEAKEQLNGFGQDTDLYSADNSQLSLWPMTDEEIAAKEKLAATNEQVAESQNKINQAKQLEGQISFDDLSVEEESEASGGKAVEGARAISSEADAVNKAKEAFAAAAEQKQKFIDANVKVKESAEASAAAIEKEIEKAREASESFASATQAKNDFANANQNVKDSADKTAESLGNEAAASKGTRKRKTSQASSSESSNDGYKDSDTYKTLIDANKKLSSAFNKIDTEVFVDKNTELGQLKTRYEELTKEIQELTKSEETLGKVSEEDMQRLSTATKQLMSDFEKYAQAKKEASKQKDSTYGADVLEKVQSQHTSLIDKVDSGGYSNASGIANKLQQYEQAYQRIIDLQKKLANIDITSDLGKKTAAEFDDAVKSFNNYGKEIENIIKKSENLQNKIGNIHRAVSEGFDLGDEASRRSELESFARSFDGLDKKSIQFSDSYSKVVFTIKNGNGEIEKITASFNQAGTAIDASSKNLGKAANKFTSFFDGVKKKTGEIATYFTGANLVYKTVTQIKQGITYVREIDAALTELKKVTDETDETYKRFLQDASKTAGQIGSTVKDFTNATADFARLGYNIEQASDLAKAASVYYNVGDDLANIGEASDSIISTMHGFGIEAENAMNIVDKFNEVGNNFAISSSGIGQALLRSASAMSEAGNTIDESIGLITAANSVVQNPESVGTAMKTLSLRIRGAKVELEDAGEDVDGMANSVSELQKKLLALTGGKVDIMLDENTFKNTTEILREISQVWDDMTDVNRAAALELLGGKRQANVLAAVINNFDLVEDAMQTSADSAGSAMAENEKYLDNIQGKIDQFTNAVQTMWMDFIRSDAVKFLVDVGTGLVNIIDKVGVLKSNILILLGVVAPLKAFLKATEGMSLAERIGKIVTAIRGFSISNIGDSINNLIKTLGLADTAFAKFIARIIEAVATEYAAAGATGVLKMAVKSLETAVLSAIAKIYVALGPVGLIIAAVTVAVGALIAAYVAWGPTHKNFIKKLEEETENLKNIRSNLDSLNSELETTKSRIEELESKGPLTLTEQEELNKLKEQNAELERQIQLEEAREERARNKQAKAAKGAFETDDDFKPVDYGIKVGNKFDEKLGSVEKAKDKLNQAEVALQDAINSGMNTESDKFKRLEKNLESAQEDYADAQSDWDEFMKGKEEEYGDLEWFDGDNLTEAQKTVNEIISTMQNYSDRAEIMFGSAGAKESALNRLFGERGSEAGKAFQEAFNAKIESGEIKVDVDKFGDYSTAIDNATDSVEGLISENPQLKVQLDSLGISAEDVARYFLNISAAMQQTNETASVTITDIATLTSAYDSYASALQIVNDAIFDGQAISDDYYDSLKEYLGSVTVGEESFSDAIDTTNGKVVKNTRLLRALIAQKKKEQKSTVSAAKAQSQLQYTKVVKQLQQAVKAMYLDYQAYGYVTKATYDNISAMRDQVQAIKNAIKEYAILELKLSDVTNAYDEFENAKNRDAELAYGDSMIEMLKAISDGFLSGKVGSEEFKAACKALVPDSVIANCTTFEERLDAIDDYFENSKFADYFTIDEDGNFSIAIKNIEAFIADAKEAGAFIGNADGTFTLANSIKSVEDLANAMGITKAAAVAMLTELSKYDASWGDIVADITMTQLDKGIRDTTDALDQAIAKQEQFFKDGKDPSGANAEEYIAIQQEINNCSDALNTAQQAVVNNTKAWMEANDNVDTAKEKVATLTRELQELQEAGATDNEIQIKTNELENATKELYEALSVKYGLEEPTQMDFQLVLTDVQAQIDKWKEENATLVTEVVPKLAQDEDGVWKIPAEAEVELNEDDKQKIQAYLDLLNDKQQLELFTSEETDPIVDSVNQVNEVLNNILDAINSLKPDTDTSKVGNIVSSALGITGGSSAKSTNNSNGTSSTSKSSSTTTATNNTTTPTSGTTGFDSEGVDQEIAAWNAMVDEWIANAQQSINEFGEGISTFFTETLPEYWNSFWASVGEKLSNVGEWAQGVGEDIGIFFTETLPQKWSEFWEDVGEWLDNVKSWASDVGEDIGEFFTETLPEKWDEFWSKVGEFITEIPYNVSYFITKVKMFFTETLPEKWDEFWDNVGEALDDLKEKAIALKDKVVEFFKVTIPQKWDEFWDAVGDVLNTLKENAIALKDKVVDFFTVTIPAEWNAFWDSVGDYINEVIVPALSSAWDKVYGFFTVTIPEKWNEFWTSVGTYVEEVIKPALSLAWEKVHDFFMVTIPEKWNEFWTGVGEFVTQTVPEAIETIKDGVTTFFTETVPGAINSLWESASSWIKEKADSFWSFLKGEWIRGKEDAETGSYNPSGDAEALGNALAKGNAHSKKKPGLNTNEHNAIVGELGRELVVDPNKGVYYTVGEHGTQMVDLPKGAIIYNHKQTEELLKNGETSRGTYTGGLSFVKGNAHWDYGTHTKKTGTGAKAAWGDGSSKDWSQMGWDLRNALDSISDAAGDISDATDSVEDAADDAKQTIDFIEYRLEEIENAITRTTNRIANFLDDTSQTKDKNNLYEEIVNAEKQKASTYFSAAATYNKKAAQLLSEVPAEYQEMAKNGAIAIKDFIGENEGEIADAIEEYRTWSSKAEDAENNYLASIAEISAKRLEQLQDIADDFENIVGLTEQHANLIQAEMDLLDEAGERLSENFYKELMKDSKKQIEDLNNKRASLQDILDNAVKSGDVQVGSDDWYEMVNAIFDVDDAILECKKDIEGFQNSINDLYWDNLDKLIDKIDNVDSELSHLYNLVSDEEKVVDEFGNWTKDGVTALGLLAQQLEVANFKVEQYGEAIAHLEKDYAAGLYSTDEYNEKLAELKENQWDAIEAQESAKKSLIDLNKTRIESVKNSIQKEIDAYSELIDKKKEELNLQKESHDFSKQVAEQQKNIADIEKRLAAISGDNSASAIAQKKKLQAELAQAKEELEELYYDHSVEKQQDALDKQLEDYQNNKQDEMDALDESLKNEDQIIQDSYATIAANTESLAQNLSDIADKYGITLSDSVTKPWLDGVDAIGTYQGQLDTSMSAFTGQLKILKQELIDLQVEADKTANSIINATNSKKDKTESARYTQPAPAQQPSPSPEPAPAIQEPPSKGSSVTVKSSATHFSRNGGNGTRMQSWVPGSTFTVYQVSGDEVLLGRNGGYTGWVKLSDIEGYAKGSKEINKDQFAFLDELGEELQLVPDGAGRLSYVKKGTGIIPADLTERLMEWGQLDPSSVLEQSKPTVSAPHIINNNIELNLQVGEVVHIEHADNNSIPNIAKAVQDQMDNYMKNVNKKLYNRVR